MVPFVNFPPPSPTLESYGLDVMSSSTKSQLPGLPGFDPDTLQPWIVQVVVAMTVLTLVCVGLRLLSRRLKGQGLWWDDWMLLFSMGWNLAVVGFIFAMYASGMGIHADLLDPRDIVMMAKWLVVAEILYAFNLGWTKLSLLMMYYRIFHVPYFKKMAYVVGAFVMAWVVCVTFLFIFICVPVQKLWYQDLPGHCINQVGTWIANAASTILTDLIILLMPLPQLWKLHLQTREKIGLTLAFCLGFFVVFASAYRTSVLFTYSETDPSYTLTPTVGWTAIEMSAGIISACLPTMLPVFNVVFRKLGLKADPNSTRNGSATDLWSKWSKSGTSRQNHTSGVAPNPDSTKSKDNLFYKLPDENSSIATRGTESETLATPNNAKLRPDVKGYKYSIKSLSQEERNGADENGIPLGTIRVESAFERSTFSK